jgi:hypothetical protein
MTLWNRSATSKTGEITLPVCKDEGAMQSVNVAVLALTCEHRATLAEGLTGAAPVGIEVDHDLEVLGDDRVELLKRFHLLHHGWPRVACVAKKEKKKDLLKRDLSDKVCFLCSLCSFLSR